MYLLVTIPVDAIEEVSVTAPVPEATLITLNPFSDRTGPLKVELAIISLLSRLVSAR
jgi:hypothetical protein